MSDLPHKRLTLYPVDPGSHITRGDRAASYGRLARRARHLLQRLFMAPAAQAA
jgi:hypothetical protein